MIHEERLRPMVKMAMFDKNEGKACKPMMQYAKMDYISMQLLKSFISGSVAYVILCIIWVLYDAEVFMNMLNGQYFIDLLKGIGIRYALFMAAYLAITYIVYRVRYIQRKKLIKTYYKHLKDISKIYDREEKLKSPTQKDR